MTGRKKKRKEEEDGSSIGKCDNSFVTNDKTNKFGVINNYSKCISRIRNTVPHTRNIRLDGVWQYRKKKM